MIPHQNDTHGQVGQWKSLSLKWYLTKMIQAFRKNSSTKMIHKNNWKYYVFRVFYGATSFRTWRYRLARTGCLLKTVSHCMWHVTKAWHHQHWWMVGFARIQFYCYTATIRLLCSVSHSYCENRWFMKTITRLNENSSCRLCIQHLNVVRMTNNEGD